MNFTLEINFGKETLNLLSALVAKSMPTMPEAIASPSVSNGKARKVDKVPEAGKEAANDFIGDVGKELTDGKKEVHLEEVKEITLPDLRAKVTAKIQGGKRDQVAALLNEFNSKSVTTLEKEKYQQFLLQLEEL